MTLYEDGSGTEGDMETTTAGDNCMANETYEMVKSETGNRSVSMSENGRCIMTASGSHSVNELMRLDSSTLISRNESADMDILCEKLGSVEMTDLRDIPRSECFNEIIDPELNPAKNQVVEKFDPVLIYTRDKDGDNLVHTGIILREVELVMMFIAKAPSFTWLSFKNLMFQTALHLSVLTNQPEITRRLIVAGIEIDARDKDGNTALHIACRDGLLKIVQYLLEPVRYQETKLNKYEIPYQTIPQDFSIKNYDGLTCLHLAAMNGHLDVVEILLDKDINVNLKEGKTGRSVLHDACLRGDANLVKLLLRHKECNINARAFDDSTPFDLARARGHDCVCMLLAAAGARYGDVFSDSE